MVIGNEGGGLDWGWLLWPPVLEMVVPADAIANVGAGHGCRGHQRWSYQEKEMTHLTSVDALVRETNRLHRRGELGMLVVMATEGSGTIGQWPRVRWARHHRR